MKSKSTFCNLFVKKSFNYELNCRICIEFIIYFCELTIKLNSLCD